MNRFAPDFLASELIPIEREKARFHIIPVPWEQTVSYIGGTSSGPDAILNASLQLELYDGEGEPGIEAGIFTCSRVNCSLDEKVMLENLEKEVALTLKQGQIPFVLGGEHSVSFAPLKAIRAAFGGERIGIVHFDAHCDLRDVYEGSKFSHACAMARALDLGFELFQIGTRAYCKEEHLVRETRGIPFIDGCELSDERIASFRLPDDFPQKIYISFDVDGLDAAVMPATGTPVPGGLTYPQALTALQNAVRGRTVVGMDLVEFAPIDKLHFADFTAAMLAYRMIGIVHRNERGA